jgi:hypothetical protein
MIDGGDELGARIADCCLGVDVAVVRKPETCVTIPIGMLDGGLWSGSTHGSTVTAGC